MATFEYVARSANGQEVSGVLTADGEPEALRALDQRQLFPVRLSERSGQGLLRSNERARAKGKVSAPILAMMYSQLADLLRAGVPLLRALDVLSRQSGKPRLKAVLETVRRDVSEGSGLADAFLKHQDVFNELEISMVRAGERGGFLEDVLKRIAVFRDHQQQIKGQVVGAMIYPIILLCLGGVIVTCMVVFFVPMFKPLFARMPSLPTPTILLLGLSDLLRENSMWVFGGLAVVVLGVRQAVISERGRRVLDQLRISLPIFGPIAKSLAICRFCRILGTLLHNGIPILTSLRIAKDSTGNQVLARAIEQASDNVKAGDRLADPLAASGHFPVDLIEMISIGEESNNLEQVLTDIAEGMETRTTRRIDLMVRMLEPLLLVIMAAMVLFIVAALLLPVFRMTSMMGR